jgi:hypothetical protein
MHAVHTSFINDSRRASRWVGRRWAVGGLVFSVQPSLRSRGGRVEFVIITYLSEV